MPRKARNGAIYPYKTTTVKKLKDGRTREYVTWKAKVDDKWYSASTYEKCNEKIKNALAERNSYGYALTTGVKLGDYARQWLEFKQHSVDPGTYSQYAVTVNLHLKPYAKTRIDSITASYARRMIDAMKVTDKKTGAKIPASLSKRRMMYTVLNQIFKNAVADRLIPTNPLDSVQPPRNRDPEYGEERDAFTPDQMRSILRTAAEMPVQRGAIYWWLLLTGMRDGEVCGATYDHLHLGETGDGTPYGMYTVEWKLDRVPSAHGCGDDPDRDGRWPCGYKQTNYCTNRIWRIPDGYSMIPVKGQWCLTRPKSQTGRIVPLVPALSQVMRLYEEATRDWPNPHNLIFRKPDGDPILAQELIEGFRELLTLAGISDAMSRVLHETRHSTVTLLYDMGVDPGMIQAIIGHSSYRMSQHYRHIDVEQRVRAVSGMEDRLGLESMLWEAPQIEPDRKSMEKGIA